MGLIPEDKIAEIRDRTDIVQVVGEYVQLRRAGVNHKGLCPFHQEKSPSFNVNQQKQFFHCFGCGESGDVLAFIMKLEGRSFLEVARELAGRAGVELPEPPRSREAMRQEREAESERAKLVRLHELTADWFRAQLASDGGARARAYLVSRGIGDKTRETFKVGYAPGGWDALVGFFESKRVPHELAERAGLVRRREGRTLRPDAPPSGATHFDVFVDRVVYALTSPMGEVIGFGGRVLEASENQPKYKNSPETLIYKKGENLFGLHAAKHAIRRGGRALLVEGNFDVMTLHEQGIDWAVAPQGTAITEAQVALVKRFARELVLMLDADPAGRAATFKTIKLLIDADLPARVVGLRSANGQKVDPDDLARNDLPRLHKLLETAGDAVELFFEQVASTAPANVPGKVAAIEECVPVLRAVRNELARDLYVGRLAGLLQVDANMVRRAMRGARELAPVELSEEAPLERAQRPLAPVHAQLLALIAAHDALAKELDEARLQSIDDEGVRTILAGAAAQGRFDAAAAVQSCAPELRDAVARAVSSDEFVRDGDPRRVLEEIFRRLCLPSDPAALEAERRAAIARGDLIGAQALTVRILSTRMTGSPANGERTMGPKSGETSR